MNKIQNYNGRLVDWMGFMAGIPNAEYHAADGISKSGLDLIAKSPAHYECRSFDAGTRNMQIGSATHAAILEPDVFAKQYHIIEVSDRRQKAWKDAVAHYGEAFCLLPSEARNILAMRDAVRDNARASELVNGQGYRELSARAKCPHTGALVRCRYDLLASGMAVDLKTTQSAIAEDFSRSVMTYRYHVQAALYSDVYRWITGDRLQEFWFVAVEPQPPYTVACYLLDDDALDFGRYLYQRNLRTYMACHESQYWPRYEPDSEYLALPAWAQPQIDEALGYV